MHGLYKALGRIASAAHANGDVIDENTYPSDDSHDKHGLDIFHDGIFMRFRDVPDEPRFVVETLIVFAPRLRNRYTPEELSERADVDYEALSSDEQEEVVEQIVRADLREAEAYEEDFRKSMHKEVDQTQHDILRLSYGDESLWNGILIRDRLFPYRESFRVEEYRETVASIARTRTKTSALLREVPPINGESARKQIRPPSTVDDQVLAGFQ